MTVKMIQNFENKLELQINSLETRIKKIIDYAKAFDCVDHNKLWKILKEMGVPPS